MLKDKIIRAVAIDQDECFKVGILFPVAKGSFPAPESTHAIAATVREALKAKEEGREKVILFNLSGHGLLDLSAYESFLNGKL